MSDQSVITWWTWMLLWSALIVALLVMLALFAWALFRKAMAVLSNASSIGFAPDAKQLDDLPDTEQYRPPVAFLLSNRDIQRREDARKAHRIGLHRRRREERLARAKRIVSLDATSMVWPAEWYRR